MYKIEQRDFGYKLTFGGLMYAEEMKRWLEESEKCLASQEDPFFVFVDMRTLKPISENAVRVMHDGQQLYKRKGMVRSVVILNNPVTTMQFKRIAQESGIYEWERYIDSSLYSDWEQIGMDWLINKVDPDVPKTEAITKS